LGNESNESNDDKEKKQSADDDIVVQIFEEEFDEPLRIEV